MLPQMTQMSAADVYGHKVNCENPCLNDITRAGCEICGNNLAF